MIIYMNSEKVLPVLRVNVADLTTSALVVGDPQRAAAAAEYLDDVIELGFYREYRTFKGTYSGVPITISSHGVGAAGASICFEELMQGGVKTIIRAGTCGAMHKDIEDGELVIGTGAIREDGTSEKLVPIAYPAIADRHIISALVDAAGGAQDSSIHTGIVLTQSHFYDGILPNTIPMWLDANMGIIAVEMELATLLVIASIYGVQAGGIFTSDGNMTQDADPLVYDPHRREVEEGVEKIIKVSLEALVRLNKYKS
jgi:uridine phosphorylase